MKKFSITGIKSVTDRSEDSVRAWLNELNKKEYDKITVEEEHQLYDQYKKGDEAAGEKMVKANLRIAVTIAKGYVNRGISFADLIEEANLSLINALEHYNPEFDNRFATYATWYVQRDLIRKINEYSGSIRIPDNVGNLLARIHKAQEFLYTKLEYDPSTGDIAELINEPVEKINKVLEASSRMTSFDSELAGNDSGDEAQTLLDVTENPDGDLADKDTLKMDLHEAEIRMMKNVLSERDADIVASLFGLTGREVTVSDLSMKYDLTETRIRQILNSSLEKLKAYQGAKELLMYL